MNTSKRTACPPREFDRATELFNQARFAEAEALAKSLTRRFPGDGPCWMLLGAVQHTLGRAGDTVASLKKAAELLPDDVEAQFNLSMALQTFGQFAAAAASYRRTLALRPDIAVAHASLGDVLQALGQFSDAEGCYRQALALQPDFLAAHYNLGNALAEQGRHVEAEACYRMSIKGMPDFVEGHCNLGIALQAQSKLEEAEACFRRGLALQPGSALAHYNLACNLDLQGRLAEAEAAYRRTLEIVPNSIEALGGLGDSLQELGRVAEAETCYRRALDITPGSVKALNHLASVLLARGEAMAALDLMEKSLRTKETWEAKLLFVDVVRRCRFMSERNTVRDLLVRALTEPWSAPIVLARAGAELVRLNPIVGGAVSQAVKAWPRRLAVLDLFEADGLSTIAADPLLHALLDAAPICEIGLEQFLTAARHALLGVAAGQDAATDIDEPVLSFFCALSRQCFINEYVFDVTDDEAELAQRVRDALIATMASEAPVPHLLLVAVAAYFPLHSLAQSPRLLEMNWPVAVTRLLAQQIAEPAEEQGYREGMRRLTDVAEGVSMLVQSQYLENPYPRWISAEPPITPVTIDSFLGRRFAGSGYQPLGAHGEVDVLIAGCGTGQNSINTAQRFQRARILAIDLSLGSLGYAMRKTRELGLTSIEYAQADIMALGALDRRFDVIESYGVLHHLADPFAGWRILLALLRPGGVMRIGLYSEVARRDVVRAREQIAAASVAATADGIRRFRQRMMSADERAGWGSIINSGDFFSTSGCRDLLFHVQEHRLRLGEIDAFLRANELRFLGFELDDTVLQAYRRRFPDDAVATNLKHWDVFESENPASFAEMYRFCVQKLNPESGSADQV